MIDTQSSFAEWLTNIVHQNSLLVETLGPRNRAGTWSEQLAILMSAEAEYDSYLRQIANGKRYAGIKVTYRIGRGLRNAGLDWCSGAFALLANPRTYGDLIALIDIVSGDDMAIAEAWMFFAEEALRETRRSEPRDDGYTRGVFTGLANYTKKLDPMMESAFDEYERRKERKANGLLGLAYRLDTDKSLGVRAKEWVKPVLEQWRIENRKRHEALLPERSTGRVSSGTPINDFQPKKQA